VALNQKIVHVLIFIALASAIAECIYIHISNLRQ